MEYTKEISESILDSIFLQIYNYNSKGLEADDRLKLFGCNLHLSSITHYNEFIMDKKHNF